METKIGVIEASEKPKYTWPEHWTDQYWTPVQRYGKDYLRITSFPKYFKDDVPWVLDHVFDTEEDFEIWYSSDMGYIDRSWKNDFRDYKQAREHLKEIIATKGGFDALSLEEKTIAAHWFLGTITQIDSVLSFDEKLVAADRFNKGSIQSRQDRFNAVMLYVWNALDFMDAVQVQQVVMQYNFEYMYIQKGQEGTMMVNYDGIPDQEGIFDFVESTTVTGFDGYGFESLAITPKYGFTKADMRLKIMDVLRNGNY